MRYAIVENDTVINIAESDVAFDSNWFEIPAGLVIDLNDTYLDGRFYNQEGQVRMTEEMQLLYNYVDELENKNTFLEECLAEVATKLYS
jgi:hypothetical protein